MRKNRLLILLLLVSSFALAGCGGSDALDADGDHYLGLIWQNPPAEIEMNWSEAIGYCEDLVLDDHNDWRLPTISELRSLIRGCPRTVAGGACEVTDDCSSASCWDQNLDQIEWWCDEGDGPENGCYWIAGLEGSCKWYWSSVYIDSTIHENAWAIYFGEGRVYYFSFTGRIYVRCVRGE